ncbi:MAG: phage major capsid protein [Provencibacterium sp.]|jgi:HK97 family phage major capsid protein|nr:phage major capsid protein [Provencibacterium sp.]
MGEEKEKKSTKLGEDDLMEKIKAAVKAAIGESAEDKEDPEGELGGETAAVTDIVEEVLDAINEKRKSRKADGEAVDELSEEEAVEIAQAIEAVIAAAPEDESKGDTPEDEPDDEEKENDNLADDKRKAKAGFRQHKARKAAPAPVQRKYSTIFLQGRSQVKKQTKSVPPVVQLARAIKCIDVFGRHDPERAAYYAVKYYSDSDMSREFKALGTVNPSSGGILIPETYIEQIIEMLYAKTVIKELGAQTVPMPNGSVTIPKMTSGTRATWGGEQRKIPTSEPTFGNLKLFGKRLNTIVPMSRELMLTASYSADQLFGNDLMRRMELGLDFGALYGTGTEYQPLGLANNENIQQIDVSKLTDEHVAKNSLITADFPVFMRAQAMIKNIDDQHLGWTFNSLIEGYLQNLKTSTGTYIYREEMASGKLLGSPYRVSNQIPLTATGTSIFFGNWSDLIIGDQMGLETYTTLDGTWNDADGVSHNAFEENLTGTRALMYVDIGTRHDESFIIAQNCQVPGSTAILAELKRLEAIEAKAAAAGRNEGGKK